MDKEAIINFLKVIEKFKTCERTCRTSDNQKQESDAEHSWHLAVFLLLLEDKFRDINFAKILKLALIHDLPEIFAGDTNPYRGDKSNKEENERKAAEHLFGSLPEPDRQKFKQLFEEYLNQNTIEARIVKAADKLMPLIQNLCTNDQYSSYRKLKVEYREVENYMSPYFQSDDILKELFQRLLNEAHNKGVFHESDSDSLT